MKARLAWLLAFCALAGWGQFSGETIKRLDEKVAAAREAFDAPRISVAIAQAGKVVYVRAFGKADTDSRYAVGSISKQFTVAALLLAQEQGKLSLDDRVAKYFPYFTRAGEVTMRQLLSHSSGFEDYAPQDYMIPEWEKATTPEALLKFGRRSR